MDQPAACLLAMDPQPSLLLAADASVVALNPALQAWVAEGPTLRAWLPANCTALVRACLRQHRAISDVRHEGPAHGARADLYLHVADCAVLAQAGADQRRTVGR